MKKNYEKIVNQTPLTNLWTDQEDLIVERERYLTKSAVIEILQKYPVEFVVADVGLRLKWIPVGKCYDFWKSEAQSHLVNDPNERFYIEDFPGPYAYVA